MEMTVVYDKGYLLSGVNYIHFFTEVGSFVKLFVIGPGDCIFDENGNEVVSGDRFIFKGEPLEVYKSNSMFTADRYQVDIEGFEKA